MSRSSFVTTARPNLDPERATSGEPAARGPGDSPARLPVLPTASGSEAPAASLSEPETRPAPVPAKGSAPDPETRAAPAPLPVVASEAPAAPTPATSAAPALPAASEPVSTAAAPEVPLAALDQLWFQVSGTVCNLRCNHCFISCSPDNHSFWFMDREEVRAALRESAELGVKEYYFTGGEPFMHRDMVGILEDTLAKGPATVLTNATLMPRRRVEALARVAGASPYTLEIRVSLDGITREMNDALRGEGAFDRCMKGVERLVEGGFLPIITTMRSWPEEETDRMLDGFRALLAGIGYDRPRLKIMPPLLIGEEAKRSRGYEASERISHEMLHGFDLNQLLCHRARLVTARGVYACPILLDYPSARLADTLTEAAEVSAPLAEQACFTCYLSGSICSNMPAGGSEFH